MRSEATDTKLPVNVTMQQALLLQLFCFVSILSFVSALLFWLFGQRFYSGTRFRFATSTFWGFFSFIFQLYKPHFDHFLTETIKSLFLGVTLKNRPQFVAGMVRVILLRTAPSCSLLWVTSLNTGIRYITFFELFGLSFSPYNTIRNALHEQEGSDKKVERPKNKRQMYKCHEP